MLFKTIEELNSRLIFNDYSAADVSIIQGHIWKIYQTKVGQSLIDTWLEADTQSIKFYFIKHRAAAVRGEGIVIYDLNFASHGQGITFIDKNGVARAETPLHTIGHELIHALEGLRDNWQEFDNYAGETVEAANLLYRELGIAEQLSYVGISPSGNLTVGRDYSDGNMVFRSWVAYTNQANISGMQAVFLDQDFVSQDLLLTFLLETIAIIF